MTENELREKVIELFDRMILQQKRETALIKQVNDLTNKNIFLSRKLSEVSDTCKDLRNVLRDLKVT